MCCSICELTGVYGDGEFEKGKAWPYLTTINGVSQAVSLLTDIKCVCTNGDCITLASYKTRENIRVWCRYLEQCSYEHECIKRWTPISVPIFWHANECDILSCHVNNIRQLRYDILRGKLQSWVNMNMCIQNSTVMSQSITVYILATSAWDSKITSFRRINKNEIVEIIYLLKKIPLYSIFQDQVWWSFWNWKHA